MIKVKYINTVCFDTQCIQQTNDQTIQLAHFILKVLVSPCWVMSYKRSTMVAADIEHNDLRVIATEM